MEEKNILEFKNVTKTFPGVKALSNVSISLKEGEVCALVGENGAGKSTLIKCMLGLYTMDEGELYIEGEPVHFHSVIDARNAGLSVIQQELSPIPMRSVMENIWLEREPMRGPFVNHKKMYDDTKALLEAYGFDIDPKELMANLSVAQQQMVEIIKAVSCGAKIVMMDEATSSLSNNEIDKLFEIVARLKSEGTAVIYITHKMDEVFAISDKVTVLRDGQSIATHATKDTSADELIGEMVGRNLNEVYANMEHMERNIGDTVLRVDDLSSDAFHHISFELHRGRASASAASWAQAGPSFWRRSSASGRPQAGRWSWTERGWKSGIRRTRSKMTSPSSRRTGGSTGLSPISTSWKIP